MPLHQHSLALGLCSGVLAETQASICRILGDRSLARLPRPRLLDVGCWDGEATARYAETLGAEMAGIEIFPEPAERALARGVDVASLDLEHDVFPWESNSFDVIVANQVFEHLKNIWLPLSEVYRVLKPGGRFVISVPNLASLHNRVLLALGRQPTSIRTLGAHVRGYTVHELIGLLTLDGALAKRSVHGVGFYPLPARLARPFAALWTGGSHTVILVAQKASDRPVSPWEAYRRQETEIGVQTFYS